MSQIVKDFLNSKMLRFILFIFIFCFIFKVIDHVFDFFDIGREMGYIYFSWFTVLFLLFVILPLKKSSFFNNDDN